VRRTLFSGCSFTAGIGFELEKQEPGLWVNLLHKSVPELAKTQLINISQGGQSNENIFASAVHSILHDRSIQYVFVAWTSVPRYEMSLGLELYATHHAFIPNSKYKDHNLHNIVYTSDYLSKINDRITTLAHPHYEIYKIVSYTNSLLALAKLSNIKIYFINAICPWDDNYFTILQNVLPSQYTKFTQELISTETRADAEIFALYNKIHNEYSQLGGIQAKHWLNLYSSMRNMRVDVNDNGTHPGLQSNQTYFQYFKNMLEKSA
jgi:hypothetical protein